MIITNKNRIACLIGLYQQIDSANFWIYISDMGGSIYIFSENFKFKSKILIIALFQ